MSKARYIFAIIVFVAVFVTGVVLACVYTEYTNDRLLYSALAYGVGAFLANLIWFDGIVVSVASFGFGLCWTVLSWFFGLFLSLLGWFIIFLFGAFIISAVAAILAFTVTAMFVITCVMFPINLFRYGGDLY